jgi:hypothetical protein
MEEKEKANLFLEFYLTYINICGLSNFKGRQLKKRIMYMY